MSSKKAERISNKYKIYNEDSKSSNDYSKSNLFQRKKNLNNNYKDDFQSNENKKINNDSNKVLENILDNKKKFNIYSPSQLKQMTEQIKIIENQKKIDDSNLKKNYSIREDEKKNIYLIESISKCLLQINKINPKFMEMELNNKILFMINFIENKDLKIRLGSIIL